MEQSRNLTKTTRVQAYGPLMFWLPWMAPKAGKLWSRWHVHCQTKCFWASNVLEGFKSFWKRSVKTWGWPWLTQTTLLASRFGRLIPKVLWPNGMPIRQQSWRCRIGSLNLMASRTKAPSWPRSLRRTRPGLWPCWSTLPRIPSWRACVVEVSAKQQMGRKPMVCYFPAVILRLTARFSCILGSSKTPATSERIWLVPLLGRLLSSYGHALRGCRCRIQQRRSHSQVCLHLRLIQISATSEHISGQSL